MMDQFVTAVTAAISKMAGDGKIEKLIGEQVEKTVAEVVKESLQKYGEFGKLLQLAVNSAVSINVSELNLPAYNDMVTKLVRAKLEKAIETIGRERLAKDIEEMIGGAAPAEVNLSDLITEFKKTYECEGKSQIMCQIERERGWTTVYIDSNHKERPLDADYRLSVTSEGKVYGAKLGIYGDAKEFFAGKCNGFAKRIFQLYAVGTKLVVDEDAVVTSMHEYD